MGINKFNGEKPLLGCVNDARLVAHVYKDHLGYAAADIELILDERADRNYVCQQIQKAVQEYEGVTAFIASHGVRGARYV